MTTDRKSTLAVACLLLPFLYPIPTFAQDIFEFTLAWEVESPGDSRFSALRSRDIDGDGISELLFAADFRLEGEMHHAVGVIVDGEIVTISDSLSDQSYGNSFAVMDFDGDSIDDVMIESLNYRILRILTGHDYELAWEQRRAFRESVTAVSEWMNPDREPEPLILNLRDYLWGDPEEGVYDWGCCQLWRGSPMEDELQELGNVPICRHIILKDNPDRLYQDYFIPGFLRIYFEQEGGETYDSLYYVLSTSYNSSLGNPDTTLIWAGDMTERVDHQEFLPARFSKVEDFNGDDVPDFAMPYWDESELDTYTVYLPIYNLADFELITEYSERLAGYGRVPTSVNFVKGIELVDIDDDGEDEILLIIRNNPIHVLEWNDNGELQLIGISSLPYLDTNKWEYHLGRFDHDGNELQIAMLERGRVVVYNMPVDWNSVNDAIERPLVPIGCSLLSSYPNPFNVQCVISFTLNRAGKVDAGVFDLMGRKVATIAEVDLSAGDHELTFNAGKLATGFYMVKIAAPNGVRASRIVLLR